MDSSNFQPSARVDPEVTAAYSNLQNLPTLTPGSSSGSLPKLVGSGMNINGSLNPTEKQYLIQIL